ncbi:5-formyltetrahydrofolate cyclo-ligase [Halosegnis marinus]|uniref:5-formyltetrahydrofolate cyclo-ligase n=1 Tax=Halosegnis marinus TaxID=3034023 RepID=A0ABD5ZM64_9EURY|nr:5-formyltetrahydrofolate cyclo-ligase [Halosegnis sp. DT85]
MDKQALRERVWDALERSGEARFPFPPHGRIPNFAGAREAAERLAARPEWERAGSIKANPDGPQLPARRRALRAGKTLYMAVPRLRDEQPFLELDPDRLAVEGVDIDDATTVRGSGEHGVPIHPDEMPAIDLILSGSVAVTPSGARVGKGEGYADLEFALLREFDRATDDTTVATTIHPMQVVADDRVTPDPHDVPLDLVATPERLVETGAAGKPSGIDWDALAREKRAEIPVLDRLHPGAGD